jgi:hypothetical protein
MTAGLISLSSLISLLTITTGTSDDSTVSNALTGLEIGGHRSNGNAGGRRVSMGRTTPHRSTRARRGSKVGLRGPRRRARARVGVSAGVRCFVDRGRAEETAPNGSFAASYERSGAKARSSFAVGGNPFLPAQTALAGPRVSVGVSDGRTPRRRALTPQVFNDSLRDSANNPIWRPRRFRVGTAWLRGCAKWIPSGR